MATAYDIGGDQGRPCPICGAADGTGGGIIRDHLSGESFHLGICRRCEGRFVVDPPDAADLGRYYDNSAGARMHKPPSPLFRWMRAKRLDRDLAPLLRHTGTDARIVDLGAGDGSLVGRLRARGVTAGALDMYAPEEWAVPGVPYAQGGLGGRFTTDEIVAPVGRPDGVIMRHVLEHVIDPAGTLTAIADSGARYAMLIVPNVASPLIRVLGTSWYYWDPPRHLTFFTPRTLARLAGRCGFRVVYGRTYGIDELVTSAHRAAALRAHDRDSRMMRRVSEICAPTGLIAGASSAASSLYGRAVIHAVLERDPASRA